jgi:hypothetical protein
LWKKPIARRRINWSGRVDLTVEGGVLNRATAVVAH